MISDNQALIGVGILFLLILLLAIYFKYIREAILDSKTEPINIRSKVISKRSESVLMSGVNNIKYRVYTYYLSFRTEDNETIIFKVSSEEYMSVEKGDIGILNYQRKRFIRFEPTNTF